MVCCIALSFLIASAALAFRAVRLTAFEKDNPLTWRLHGAEPRRIAVRRPDTVFTWRARLRSFAFAIDGLRRMVRNEHNARLHLAATFVAVAVSIWLGIDYSDWRWIFVSICWVWFAEAANTALEHLCDVVSPERNETVRFAKDIAAGGVLISSIAAAIIGVATLYPYFAAEVLPGFDALPICRGR